MRYAITLILLAAFGCGQSSQTVAQRAAADALAKIEADEYAAKIDAEQKDHLRWLEYESNEYEREAASVVHNTYKETNKQLLRDVASGALASDAADVKRMAALRVCRESLAEIVRKSRAKTK